MSTPSDPSDLPERCPHCEAVGALKPAQGTAADAYCTACDKFVMRGDWPLETAEKAKGRVKPEKTTLDEMRDKFRSS